MTVAAAGLSVIPLVLARHLRWVNPSARPMKRAYIRVMSFENVKVFGSFHFTESCTFDSERNLILSMNAGNRGAGDIADDGFVS